MDKLFWLRKSQPNTQSYGILLLTKKSPLNCARVPKNLTALDR